MPWHKKIDWGYFIPYMVTGVLNQHPRAAMAHMDSDKKDSITEFFNQMTTSTDLV
jgi:4-hydroxy 2-oxovalerate aldolase